MRELITVGMGEMKVVKAKQATLVCRALGSCVAVALFDKATGVAALAHVVLPHAPRASGADAPPRGGVAKPGRFADRAVRKMLLEMRRRGTNGKVEAKIAGGARMFDADSPLIRTLGRRNVQTVRQVLSRECVSIVGADTGGRHARSVFFDVTSGELLVKSMDGEGKTL